MSFENEYAGQRAVVMGLGLHGGGLECARFLASRGADCIVTDLRDETILRPSLEKLAGLPIRYVLGRHEMDDFRLADLVVKNPAVRPDSPYLTVSRRVETDISLFLRHCPARITAVTGSKGKSTTASALHWGLERAGRRAFLGGNITVSPLSFLEDIRNGDEVVLELSSWQLGDLRGRTRPDGIPLLKPRVAVLTAILPDHLDRYGDMVSYVADKRVIYSGQDAGDLLVCGDDEWGRSFAAESRARIAFYADCPLPDGLAGGWLVAEETETGGQIAVVRDPGGGFTELVPDRVLTPGRHQKRNLLAAALALRDLAVPDEIIRDAAASFPGIEHRLEFFHEAGGVRYYNDSAATIPEAAAAAVDSFQKPPVLVAGGTDKALDFSPLADAAIAAKAVILLMGTGSEKLRVLLDASGIRYAGPYDRLDDAVAAARLAASSGDAVVLSPGCASFGMFLNEFDRGRKWKEAVRRLTGPDASVCGPQS